LHEDGACILAVSDSKGGIYNGADLDPIAVMKYKDETGTAVGFPGCDFISNKDLLELKCDVLVPAALENTITMDNVDRIKAKIVAGEHTSPWLVAGGRWLVVVPRWPVAGDWRLVVVRLCGVDTIVHPPIFWVRFVILCFGRR